MFSKIFWAKFLDCGELHLASSDISFLSQTLYEQHPYSFKSPLNQLESGQTSIIIAISWFCSMNSSHWKNATHAHAKIENWIFDAQFPGNWFEFGIILNNFWSSTIWAIPINISSAEFKNPGIKPIDFFIFFLARFEVKFVIFTKNRKN